MSAGKYPRTFPPDEASSWRRIRRYAVPRWMIKQATERRLAGDWQGACAAANVDVTFDLADVANEHGQATATRLEEDLRNFAPDLIRWHLPRYLRGRTTLRPDQRVLLAGYGDQPTDGPYLYVTTMPTRSEVPVSGCFAVRQAWESGTGWLPKTLRAQRREFFSLVQHGDTPNVLRLLDAGMDPHIRDSRQRTLLHLLHLLDHKLLLPRLLKAGLDLEARDHNQRTPLHVAVGEGPESLVHALLDAGARIDVMDNQDRALSSLILFRNRTELRFLMEEVIRDYPNLPGVIWFPARGDITYEDLIGMSP